MVKLFVKDQTGEAHDGPTASRAKQEFAIASNPSQISTISEDRETNNILGHFAVGIQKLKERNDELLRVNDELRQQVEANSISEEEARKKFEKLLQEHQKLKLAYESKPKDKRNEASSSTKHFEEERDDISIEQKCFKAKGSAVALQNDDSNDFKGRKSKNDTNGMTRLDEEIREEFSSTSDGDDALGGSESVLSDESDEEGEEKSLNGLDQYTDRLLNALDSSPTMSSDGGETYDSSVLSEIDSLNYKLQESMKTIKDLKRTVEALRECDRQNQRVQGLLKAKVEEKDEDLKKAKDAHENVLEQLEEKRKAMIDLAAQLKASQEESQENFFAMKDMYITTADQKFFAAELERELSSCREEQVQMSLDHANKIEQMQITMDKERVEYKSHLKSLKDDITAEVRDKLLVEAREKAADEKKKAVQELQDQVDGQKVELQRALDNLGQLQIESKEKQVMLDEYQTKLKNLEDQNKDQSTTIQKLNEKNESLTNQYQTLYEICPQWAKKKIATKHIEVGEYDDASAEDAAELVKSPTTDSDVVCALRDVAVSQDDSCGAISASYDSESDE